MNKMQVFNKTMEIVLAALSNPSTNIGTLDTDKGKETIAYTKEIYNGLLELTEDVDSKQQMRY